jgi:hypothetical protein
VAEGLSRYLVCIIHLASDAARIQLLVSPKLCGVGRVREGFEKP